ncbi:MAG: CARDB domain-containing protein [Minisyncoccia bacterium]
MLNKIWLKIKEMFNTASATIVVVIVVVLLVWAAVTVLPKAIAGMYSYLTASLSSTFIASENIAISADKTNIKSGETLNILVNNKNDTNSLNTLYYPCSDGVSVLLNDANGASTNAPINCGEDFYLLNKNGVFALTINSEKVGYVSIPLTVKSQNEKKELENIGSITIGITNEKVEQESNTKIEKPIIITNPSPVSPIVSYYGNSDLSVKILSVDTSNIYNLSVADQVLIKFEVKNIGTNKTGSWMFGANLPSSTMSNYSSDLQRNLNPGDKIQYVLGFGNVDTTNSSIINITVDPSNQITESNESNNSTNYTLVYDNSNNQIIHVNSSNNNYYYSNNDSYQTNYGNLSGSCRGNSTVIPNGSTINWTASASGGNGNYTYLWSSSDRLLYGYSQNITYTYPVAGLKYATVTITSGGQTINVACTANTYTNGNNYNASSDLNLSLVSVGTIDGYGRFMQTGQILKGQTAAAKILVMNNGSAETGPWGLVASFAPSYPTNSFQLTNQPSLNPGERREVIVTFLNVQQIGDNGFSVLVDPNNQTSDSNKNNNSLSASLRVY